MATEEQKQDLILNTVKQGIEIAYFFALTGRLGLMDVEQRRKEFMSVWTIEVVTERLSYAGFWHKQHDLLYRNS